MEQKKGSISFFATYRPPVALEIYSSLYPSIDPTRPSEVRLTDGVSYNYNGRAIPSMALKKMLQNTKFASKASITAADVDSGRVSRALIFVSERTEGLETLHIALQFNDKSVKVINFAEVYDTFNGARLEDSGCIAGDYIVYVSTMEDPGQPHQPWTAVFRTHLVSGGTERLTPPGIADLSPSVSPDGTRLAVASFEGKNGGWDGEIEDLETNIFVVDLDDPSERKMIVRDGGWPTWGSNDTLFFHRNIEKVEMAKRWGVFRVNVDKPSTTVIRVTPDNINAITPAAINENTVAVATVREPSKFGDERHALQYRHIEIFEVSNIAIVPKDSKAKITQKIKPLADHFNPFIIVEDNGQTHIGYHRCKVTDNIDEYAVVETNFNKIKSPDNEIGLFRVSGVFPTFSPDGSKIAFVDNEFKGVWVADGEGLRRVYEMEDSNSVFAPVWNQNPKKDILYISKGPSFSQNEQVHICAIPVAAHGNQRRKQLTKRFNNAFPSTNPEGTKLVFRSTRDGNKNLYIMEDADNGEFGDGELTRLTEGKWTDTHCQWSPNGDWIVFASNRANPTAVKKKDLPDPGFFGIYLVKANNPNSWVKVMDSGFDMTRPGRAELFAGHVTHPCFSPDGKNIVVAADLAAVSCEPISLPLFSHSVRPYGDVFIVELEMADIKKNENLTKFIRLTHSRYENSTAVWTMFSTDNTSAKWNLYLDKPSTNESPYIDPTKGESFLVTGHLCIGRRCC